MILSHHQYFRSEPQIHCIIDDFGNEIASAFDGGKHGGYRAWGSAYRFAMGQSFDQAGMHSIVRPIPEH